MKVELLHDARVEHKAGEVVDTTPACADLLIRIGLAKPVAEVVKEEPKKKITKKKVTE